MNTPTGFLVVRTISPPEVTETGSYRSRYAGVDRVPPFPPEDSKEHDAVEEYVFGDYKDDTTNLIPSLDAAARLQRMLSSSKQEYEILFCCDAPETTSRIGDGGVKIEQLGYDVAAVRSDYWSIVADFSRSDWASRYRNGLNGFGLFARKMDAEAYLREYRDRGEPDRDSPFDVVYVARVFRG